MVNAPQWPSFHKRAHYPSGRTWENIRCSSGYALLVKRMKKGTRRIIRLDEPSSVVRLERRTTEDSSSKRIMRPLVYRRPMTSIENEPFVGAHVVNNS